MNYPQAARRLFQLGLLATFAVLWPVAHAEWVEFVDATASILDAAPGVLVDDLQEKDYAWGDVDNDGDIDLVIVRKEPFTTPGKFRNLLLMNEGGVLTDRTAEYASFSDVPGDNGFQTPTNDRDVVLVDVDLDGWLDIVTAVTLGEAEAKHIGHPRVYRNLGCFGTCASPEDWLGFIHEDERIPQLLTYDGQVNWNPRFCAVSAGDLTGDGYPDLYFTDYDEHVGDPPPGEDFNDKLLINRGTDGPGFFVDQTDQRFAGLVPDVGLPFELSDFGTASAIVDMNGDEIADIVKANSLVNYYVGIAFNGPSIPGFFDTYAKVWHGAPYFVSTGDLNNDDWPDLIVTDDGADRYLINKKIGVGEVAEFVSHLFSFSHSGSGIAAVDDGFGSNSLAVDLDGDGWKDVLIADVDADVPACNRRMHIYKNQGGTPGGNVTIEELTSGSGCAIFNGYPPTCLVASIPSNKLIGVHDVAVFDINGDGWNDMVIGRCTGTEAYLQVPPGSPVGSTPDGTEVPGQQLVVGKSLVADHITLTWGESCVLDDDDYAVYEGQLGNIGGQSPVVCSTLGATTHELLPGSTDTYYLIVPNNGNAEGSYGQASNGVPRQLGPDACYPQNTGACE